MGKQLRECDLTFACLRKFRTELGYATRQLDPALLQDVQQTCAAQTFRRGPKQYDCVGAPGHLALRVAKSAVQLQDRFSVLPNGDGRTELAKVRKILVEQ
jgi:hypothetical protein